MKSYSHMLIALALSVALTACANAPRRTPLESAMFASGRSVDQSLDEASEAANERESYELRVRYNAPHCGAPVFEVLVYGRWSRVFLDGREDMLNQLEDDLVGDDPNRGIRVALAIGTMVGERETRQGLEFPVFEVESYEATPSE